MVSITTKDAYHIDLGKVVSKKIKTYLGKKIVIIKTSNGEIVMNLTDYKKVK